MGDGHQRAHIAWQPRGNRTGNYHPPESHSDVGAHVGSIACRMQRGHAEAGSRVAPTGRDARTRISFAFCPRLQLAPKGRRAWIHCRRQRSVLSVLRALCAVLVVAVMRGTGTAAYLIKSHLHWERVGAFPHYLAEPADGDLLWPKTTLCYNGPSCAKNGPDYQCNPNCGEPTIGLKDAGLNYPKAYLIRFVIDLVVDMNLFQEFKISLPKVGGITQLGTFCRDIKMPLDAADNCETRVPFWVMNITQDAGFAGYAHLQHTSWWDYSTNPGLNGGLAMQSARASSSNGVLHDLEVPFNAVPLNLTVGYNFSTGLFGFDESGPLTPELPRCPKSPFMKGGAAVINPACYCLTARCLEEDEDNVPGNFIGTDEWTASSVVTFYRDDTTFRMGVTPNTQHHSPRIFAPTVLYLPLIQPFSMGIVNHSFYAIQGADEDGSTVLHWSTGKGSVLTIAKDGLMTIPALATENDLPWPDKEKWPNWHKWWSWKVKVQALDYGTDSPVISTMTMTARLCASEALQFVPYTVTDAGIDIKALGKVGTIYVKNWGPSCIDPISRQRKAMATNHSADECSRVGGLFITPNYFTKPETAVECHIDQPCQFEVHAVRLDFETSMIISCKWSNQLISAGQKFCHDLAKADVDVIHDGFHISYSGEHEHETSTGGNAGKLVIKPFRGRPVYKNPYSFDIGRLEVFCVTSTSTDMGEAACPSLPHCVRVEVKGRMPVITSPKVSETCSHRTKNDVSEYLEGQCPDLYSCWGSDTVSEITLSAEDADIGETVTIVVDKISTYTRYSSQLHNLTEIAYPNIMGSADGGVDVNDHCRARAKDPNEEPPSRKIAVNTMSDTSGGGGIPPLANVLDWQNHHCGTVVRKVTFRNEYADDGLSPMETKITPRGHRYTSMNDDSVICYTVSDNQAEVWGRGVNNKFSRCHIWRLRGAPVFQYSPNYPLDTPFGGQNKYDIGLTELTLTARLSEMVSFTFRARDPNPEDSISILFLEDPGIPNEATLSEQTCVDYGSVSNFMNDGENQIPRTYAASQSCAKTGSFCSTISSPCNEAHRTFSWIPTPGAEGITFKVCAIAKDFKDECGTHHTRRPDACPWTPSLQFKDTCVLPSTLGSSKRSTQTGYYNREHCVHINVIAPNPRWDAGTVPTEAGVNKLAHVGCDISWKISATDLNNYTMKVELDADTALPEGAEMITVKSGSTTHKEFRWTPQRGMEGSHHTICWRAWAYAIYPSQLSTADQGARLRNSDGTTELPMRCVNIRVRRCKYCVQETDSLHVKMKEYSMDMNWLRLWAANGNEDGDDLTQDVEDPGLLGTGVLDGVHNGQLLNIGPIYRFQAGDTLMSVAGRFRTTIRSLLDLNPDVLDPDSVQPGQELCFVPCIH